MSDQPFAQMLAVPASYEGVPDSAGAFDAEPERKLATREVEEEKEGAELGGEGRSETRGEVSSHTETEAETAPKLDAEQPPPSQNE